MHVLWIQIVKHLHGYQLWFYTGMATSSVPYELIEQPGCPLSARPSPEARTPMDEDVADDLTLQATLACVQMGHRGKSRLLPWNV